MATNTASPSPTRIATAAPGAATRRFEPLLSEAQRHKHNGDYAQAATAYQALLDQNPPPEVARDARYGLAESALLARDYAAAALAWEAFLVDYPEDGRLPHATMMLARAYDAMGNCAQAVPAYQASLAAGTVLADLAHEGIGDCLAADPARVADAVAAYRKALSVTQDVSVKVSLREKIAGLLLAQGDHAGAVAEYDAILAVAKIEDYRAKIEYLAGQALVAGGQADAGHTRYLRAVNTYPKAAYAYLSLIELVNAGVAVDEFQRGLVDYYAGANNPDAYGAAISAFDRYLASPSPAEPDHALYLKALAQHAIEQYTAELATLDSLIEHHPQSQYLASAWYQKAVVYAALGDNNRAVRGYYDVAAFFPAHTLAPQALYRAARIRESARAFSEAAGIYEDLQARFPAYENADEALWRAGLSYYQAGISPKAITSWQALTVKYPKSAYRTKSLYWLGKLGAKPETGPAYWDQVAQAEPRGYYTLRIGHVRSGSPMSGARMNLAPVQPPPWSPAAAAAEIEAWLAQWTELPAGVDVATVPVTITRRVDFRRGQALWAVGLRTEALSAFDTVRSAVWNRPVALAQLAVYWHDQGFYGLAARCASRLAGLAPGATIQKAPPAVQRLSYPLAYTDLLSAESQARGLDPLLLAALIRQESLFEPAAESYAGARGLGQVMPGTGEGIARNLGMDGFQVDDLYRPWVSVKFAAYYIAVQLQRFDNQLLVALSAYNGGPGNATRWLELGGSDLDLYVELITASQSRIYLQRVYEQYVTYESLYRGSATQ